MKHKHYECILAWAEGKQIQVWSPTMNEWLDWLSERSPSWLQTEQGGHCSYRIKPEVKPEIRPQWQQDLIDAVKAGKVVEYNWMGSWDASLINSNPDNYTFSTTPQEHYRIKPEIKPDKVKYFSIGRYGAVKIDPWQIVLCQPNTKATFDGETGLLKSVEMYERIN